MAARPVVSVIIASHTNPQYLRQALLSVYQQTYQAFEILLIDDGSPHSLSEIVSGLGDERLQLIHNQTRQGLTKSLNRGIAVAQGKYIARLDDDDVWSSPTKLAQQVQYLEDQPTVAVCGTQAAIISTDNQIIGQLHYPTDDAHIRQRMLFGNQFVHSSVLIRQAALEQAGGYDERIMFGQDYELWLRLGGTYQLANLPIVGVHYRVHPNSLSQQYALRRQRQLLPYLWRYRHHYPHFYYYLPSHLFELLRNVFTKIVRRAV